MVDPVDARTSSVPNTGGTGGLRGAVPDITTVIRFLASHDSAPVSGATVPVYRRA
jgi:hypothetical protein